MENANQSLATREMWDGEPLEVGVTLDVPAGGFRFEWVKPGQKAVLTRGFLVPDEQPMHHMVLFWKFEGAHRSRSDFCGDHPSSTRALLQRIRRLYPLVPESPLVGLLTDTDLGMAQANRCSARRW